MWTCQFCAPHRSRFETHVGSKHHPRLPFAHDQAIGHSPWQFLVQCFSSTGGRLFEGVECNSMGTCMCQSPTFLCRGGHGVHRSHAWFGRNWQQLFLPSCLRGTFIPSVSFRLFPPPLRMRPFRTRLPWSVPSSPSSSPRQVVRSFPSPQAATSPAGSFPATRTCGSPASWPRTRSDSWDRPALPTFHDRVSPLSLSPRILRRKGFEPYLPCHVSLSSRFSIPMDGVDGGDPTPPLPTRPRPGATAGRWGGGGLTMGGSPGEDVMALAPRIECQPQGAAGAGVETLLPAIPPKRPWHWARSTSEVDCVCGAAKRPTRKRADAV